MAYTYFVTNVNGLVRNMESAAHAVLESLRSGGDSGSTTPLDLEPTAPDLTAAPAGAR
jgi:hypothetical protein